MGLSGSSLSPIFSWFIVENAEVLERSLLLEIPIFDFQNYGSELVSLLFLDLSGKHG